MRTAVRTCSLGPTTLCMDMCIQLPYTSTYGCSRLVSMEVFRFSVSMSFRFRTVFVAADVPRVF